MKIGILGFAHPHVHCYCSEWAAGKSGMITVHSGWDHDLKRLENSAKAYGCKPYSDPDEMLSDKELEGVVIASETSMHADLAEKAAAAGKAIVLQKPMALTIPEADRIADAVKRHGVPFSIAWQMRVDPQNIKIRELLDSGSFGKIFMVRRRHGLSIHLNPNFVNTWHVNPVLNRDIWADDAAHAIDFIYWLLGKPESVTAELSTLSDVRTPNDNGIAIFRYDGGPMASVYCSFTCPAAENTTEIFAEKGSIIQNYGDNPGMVAIEPGAPRSGLKWYTTEYKKWVESDIPTPPAHSNRIYALALPIAEFFNGRRAPLADAEEGRTSLRMVLATYLSSNLGERVMLDDERINKI